MVKAFSLASDLAGLDTARSALTDPTNNGLQVQLNRRLCDALATQPGEFASEWYFPAGLAQQFCVPYYEQNGDTPPTAEGAGFTGGQCEGVRYFPQIRNTSGNWTTVISSGVYGPISSFEPNSASADVFEVVARVQSGAPATYRSPTIGNRALPLEKRVIRADGQPDTCGDPPPGPIQPSPDYSNPVDPTQPVTVDYGDNNQSVSVDFDVRQDVDGDEYINISGPNFEVNVGSNGGEPRLPENQPEATDGAPSQPTGDGGEVTDDLTQEEEQEGLETIGYAWSLSNYPNNAGIVQDTNPDVFFTPLGNVQLVYDVNGSDRFSDNLPIRAASGTIIRNDASLKVRAVRFNKRPDVGGITLTPIRRVKADAS